jgi:hypothetical protein
MEKLSDCAEGEKVRSDAKTPIGLTNKHQFNRNDGRSRERRHALAVDRSGSGFCAAPSAVAMGCRMKLESGRALGDE